MLEIGLLRQRIDYMREIEKKADRMIFDRGSYVKFLPLILNPGHLDWLLANRCDPTSRRRLMIVSYGRDPIAYEGWLRFAIIAIYSVLHCRGIDKWAVDLIMGPPPNQYMDLPVSDLFGETEQHMLDYLKSFGVTVIHSNEISSPGDSYRLYDSRVSLLLRLDADGAMLPDAIKAPCFTFRAPIGYSGLNARHTGRNAYDQLFHPTDGRMNNWPTSMRASWWDWVEKVTQIGAIVLGVHVKHDIVSSRMKAISWLSEGLSYLHGDLIEAFVSLRVELIRNGIIPEWDEEIVKVIMVGLLGIEPEKSLIPILEHWEYGPQIPSTAMINFRNQRSMRHIVRSILDGDSQLCTKLNYICKLTDDIPERVLMKGSMQ